MLFRDSNSLNQSYLPIYLRALSKRRFLGWRFISIAQICQRSSMEKEREIARMICSNFAIIAFDRERKFISKSFSRAINIYSRPNVPCLTCSSFPRGFVFKPFLIFLHATELLHHAWIYARPPVPKKVRYECRIKTAARNRDRWPVSFTGALI